MAIFVGVMERGVVCGSDHTLVLDWNGDVWAFGSNQFSQLGLQDARNQLYPTKVEALRNIVSMACGCYHSACVDKDGYLWTFGGNENGESGRGTDCSKLPQQIPNVSNATSVQCGHYHTMFIDSNDNLWGFGLNSFNQTGVTGTKFITTPEKVLSDVHMVACGAQHTLCVTNNGRLIGFGRNDESQLGLEEAKTVPLTELFITGLESNSIRKLACGEHHSLVLSEGFIYSAGHNEQGQLGRESGLPKFEKVNMLPEIIDITCGNRQSLCVDVSNNLWKFGSSEKNWEPVCFEWPADIVEISYGGFHVIVKDACSRIWVCGQNTSGQLGLGHRNPVGKFIRYEGIDIIKVPSKIHAKSSKK